MLKDIMLPRRAKGRTRNADDVKRLGGGLVLYHRATHSENPQPQQIPLLQALNPTQKSASRRGRGDGRQTEQLRDRKNIGCFWTGSAGAPGLPVTILGPGGSPRPPPPLGETHVIIVYIWRYGCQVAGERRPYLAIQMSDYLSVAFSLSLNY